MNCKECKSPVPENANFCPNCGQKIELKIKTKPKTANITKETSSLSKSGNAYTFILVAIIAAFVVVVIILNSNKKDKEKEPTNNISTNALDNGNEIKVLAEKLLVDPESLSLNIEMGNLK